VALYPDLVANDSPPVAAERPRAASTAGTEKDAKLVIDPDEIVEVMARSDQRVLPPAIAILHEDRDVIVILKSQRLLT